MIGKLNHAAFIIPLSRYFLNRLRHTEILSKNFSPQKLSNGRKEDINLFKDLLAIMIIQKASLSKTLRIHSHTSSASLTHANLS